MPSYEDLYFCTEICEEILACYFAFSLNKMITIEVTTRFTGINYNCNDFSFFSNRNITKNNYFINILLKTIPKVLDNTYTGSEWIQLQVISLVTHQRRFEATFQ